MIMSSTVVDCFNPLFIVTLLQWQMLIITQCQLPNLTPNELLRLKKKNVMFPISRPTGQNLRRLQLFLALRKKKKKVGDRPCSTIPVFIKSQNHFVTRICPRRFSDIFGL